MTEAEWVDCANTQRMLRFLRERASLRSLVLFVCARQRRDAWQSLTDYGRDMFVNLEDYADKTNQFPEEHGWTEWWRLTTHGAFRNKPNDASLIREIFGNPFRPIGVNPIWLTPTVTNLTQTIYEDRAFDRLPILADALEEAGCTDANILNHCRQPGEHVRGCWVVDLLLGKK